MFPSLQKRINLDKPLPRQREADLKITYMLRRIISIILVPVLMTGLVPLLTEFCIQHKLERCGNLRGLFIYFLLFFPINNPPLFHFLLLLHPWVFSLHTNSLSQNLHVTFCYHFLPSEKCLIGIFIVRKRCIQ